MLSSTKVETFAICALILLSFGINPIRAQLTPTRDLSGTWQSSISGTYYDMDPSDSSARMNDITATFTMVITQTGNQIDIILTSHPTSWKTDPSYWDTYGIDGVPPAGGIDSEFIGTVSSSSFSADNQGSHLVQEHLAGTFTTDIITATLTGTSESTDLNGIVVTRTGSAPTQSTSYQTSTPSTTNQPASRYFGNVGSVKGQVTNPVTGASISTGPVYSGTEIQTGDSSIVAFTPPDQGGTVYLGANSNAGWVALTSQPAPNNGIIYSIYPTRASDSSNWREGFSDMLLSVPLEASFAVLIFGEAIGTASAVAVVVEGGVYILHQGSVYIKETTSHLIAIPQGAVIGKNTEYLVNVYSNGTSAVQVINGPVIFIDPITNNTATVDTNQMLTLPPKQPSGFSTQSLQSDVSSYNSASTDQWWTQAINSSPLSSLFDQPALLVAIVLLIGVAIGVPAVAVNRRRRKGQAAPEAVEASPRFDQNYSKQVRPLTKMKIIDQSIIMLVFLSVLSYVVITAINSSIALDQQLGNNTSFYSLLEIFMVLIMMLGFVGGLVGSIRTYRRQQTKPALTPSVMQSDHS